MLGWRVPIRLSRSLLLVVAVLFVLASGSQVAHAAGEPAEVVAGNGAAGSSGDGGPAVQASLDSPAGVAVGPDGTLYISDPGSHTVRAVAGDGTITTVAGTGRAAPDSGAEIAEGATGTEVDLRLPDAVAVGADGTVYIADAGLLRVFALSQGRLSTVVGTGRVGAGDVGSDPARETAIGAPGGLAVSPDGTVYVADLTNHCIYAISPDGAIRTVAGNGGDSLTAAGGPATEVPVPAAASLAVDSSGALWMADGQVLRRLTNGTLETVTSSYEKPIGRWDTSAASSWPPPEQAYQVSSVAAVGADVYVIESGAEADIVRIRPGNEFERVASAAGLNITRSGPAMAVAASGHAFLIAQSEHRVYGLPLASGGGTGGGGSGGTGAVWWPYVVGAVVVVVAVGWLLSRRRGSRAERKGGA